MKIYNIKHLEILQRFGGHLFQTVIVENQRLQRVPNVREGARMNCTNLIARQIQLNHTRHILEHRRLQVANLVAFQVQHQQTLHVYK